MVQITSVFGMRAFIDKVGWAHDTAMFRYRDRSLPRLHLVYREVAHIDQLIGAEIIRGLVVVIVTTRFRNDPMISIYGKQLLVLKARALGTPK